MSSLLKPPTISRRGFLRALGITTTIFVATPKLCFPEPKSLYDITLRKADEIATLFGYPPSMRVTQFIGTGYEANTIAGGRLVLGKPTSIEANQVDFFSDAVGNPMFGIADGKLYAGLSGTCIGYTYSPTPLQLHYRPSLNETTNPEP